MTQATKDTIKQYALPTVGGIIAAILALTGFETKAAHSESIREIRQEQKAIHDTQENNHKREYDRVICLLQEIKQPAGAICP